MRIILANVKYSPNLGDGLLCECLERELRATSPGLSVDSVDLAGRTDYAAGGASRRLKLMVLEALPRPVRSTAAEAALRWIGERHLRPHWRERLAPADAMIVGGGNLFADADLNFPIKISLALQEAARRRLPVSVFGVGVSRNWTPRGRHYFQSSLAAGRLVDVMVRDEASRAAWDAQLDASAAPRAAVTVDPGVLTFRHFATPARRDGTVRIGLGLTDPLAVRYHGGAVMSEDVAQEWLGTLVASLAEQDCDIVLFTNGSPEDRGFLQRSRAALAARAPGRVAVADDFRTPADLAGFVGSCDVVLAHRMHACIAAYSYRVPTIGFSWDPKLKSFFDLTKRDRFIVDLGVAAPAAVAGLAREALAEGIDEATHRSLVDQCSEDVARLAERLFTASRHLP